MDHPFDHMSDDDLAEMRASPKTHPAVADALGREQGRRAAERDDASEDLVVWVAIGGGIIHSIYGTRERADEDAPPGCTIVPYPVVW